MPTIAYIGAIQVRIYYDDHGIPHFHAVSPEFDFKIAIADCSIISATVSYEGATWPLFAPGDKSTATC